jgi:methylmalonyl-CoA/ethylmalonyl-CoA epimerase
MQAGSLKLHHVGIVANSLVSHGAIYRDFLGVTADPPIFGDPIQRVRVQFLKDSEGQLLELLEPAAADSPVMRALAKGGGLNHLCYEVANIEDEVRTAVERGAIQIGEIAPAVALGGRRIAFLFLPRVNLVEFAEALRK